MNVTTGLFYAFAAIMLFAAFRVITARNPVHAALFLVLTFFQAAMVWMLLKAEFLSITLVLVYVGAVMVLFLFVVMMLDVNMENLRKGFWKNFPLAATIGGLIALELTVVFMQGFGGVSTPVAESAAAVAGVVAESNTSALGKLLYSRYVYPLEVAAAILLVAMIAAIALTLRARKDSKYASPSEQVRVKARDRMTVLQMPATQKAAQPEAVPAETKA